VQMIQKKKAKPECDEEDIDLIGLLPDNRVAVKYPFILLDESFCLPKSILGIGNKVNIRTNLKDSHIYILSNFILHVIEQNPSMSSLKRDIVPLIIKNQFRSSRIWYGIGVNPELKEEERLVQEMSCGSFNTVSESNHRSLNPVSCFAFIIPASEHLCERMNSIAIYGWMNREILVLPKTPSRCFDSLVGFRKKEASVIGENCTIYDQVNLKLCCIGNNCAIGAKCKINQCVIMDNVQIAENCLIQNSIICSGSIIGEGCNLNDCQVGPRTVITAGTRLKSTSVNRDNI